jgi:endonuclease/exonuclease/phosphatase family metal-dependent hydrolase
MITQTVAALAPLTQSERAAIAALPRTVASHDAHMASLPCMTTLEHVPPPGTAPLPFPLTIAAWNLERCLFPKESAAMLAASGAQVVLLSEMDKGMARTAQAHATADVASTLGMGFAYGAEFIELGLGSETERAFCRDDHNALGFHGNAILAGAMERPFMLRLAGTRNWFLQGGDQPRMGERMAIGAVIPTAGGPFVAVSTHLESNADAARREAQVAGLIDALDAAFPGLPVVIGGDLNTGNHIGGDWRDETLFAHAASRGFATHGGPLDQMTTRPSLITRWPDRAMKLDWFLTRGVRVERSWIVPSPDDDGRPLSDHDMVVLTVGGPT